MATEESTDTNGTSVVEETENIRMYEVSVTDIQTTSIGDSGI